MKVGDELRVKEIFWWGKKFTALEKDDVIESIGQHSCVSMTLEEAKVLLQGKHNSSVTVGLRRHGAEVIFCTI